MAANPRIFEFFLIVVTAVFVKRIQDGRHERASLLASENYDCASARPSLAKRARF